MILVLINEREPVNRRDIDNDLLDTKSILWARIVSVIALDTLNRLVIERYPVLVNDRVREKDFVRAIGKVGSK
jgi:hypothetical protein